MSNLLVLHPFKAQFATVIIASIVSRYVTALFGDSSGSPLDYVQTLSQLFGSALPGAGVGLVYIAWWRWYTKRGHVPRARAEMIFIRGAFGMLAGGFIALAALLMISNSRLP